MDCILFEFKGWSKQQEDALFVEKLYLVLDFFEAIVEYKRKHLMWIDSQQKEMDNSKLLAEKCISTVAKETCLSIEKIIKQQR